MRPLSVCYDFVRSIPLRLRWKKGVHVSCPMCGEHKIKIVNQVRDQEENIETEAYLCCSCGCEWDWTFKRRHFGFRVKIRAPKWVKID